MSAGAGRGERLGLNGKIALLVGAVVVALTVFLIAVVGPRTVRAVQREAAPLVAQSTEQLRRLASEDARASSEVLRTLIQHSAQARRATLADVPLELLDGDPVRIQAAISAKDAAMSHRLVENVGLLSAEMEARALQRIAATAAALDDSQRALAQRVASDVRDTNLLVLGIGLAALLALLALGLHRSVVQPVRELQRAAQTVAAGNLDVQLSGGRGGEVGDLARSFTAMVAQLRASRAEVESKREALAALNASLEADVAAKTAELRQALDGLRAAQRELVLAERMASVGTLAGGIAHEFNNLAGGIRGCALEVLEGEQDPARREPLEVIARAAERAIDVTDKLLRFARPKPAGTAVLDLAVILRDALRLVEPQARRQQVKVAASIDDRLTVRGDGSALHQVVINLLGNALQAMAEGGELTLAGSVVGDDVVVTVRDTGIGIATADLDRIFDPFFTTRGAEAATPGRGAGLGLAVTYGIVQAHAGRLQVDSVKGQGSTFTVRLPRHRSESVEGSSV